MQKYRVADLGKYVGQEVELKGWLYNKRDIGKVRFILVRDGSGIVQGVMVKNNLPEEVWDKFDDLTLETSLIVRGTVREEKRAPGGYELDVTDIEIFQIADGYPITKKSHGVEFLMDHRHLWLRSKKQWAIMRIRDEIQSAIMDFLREQGFVRIDAPILTSSAAEGTTTLFEVDYHGDKAYLSQSGQLYMEAAAMAHGKVYCFGPAFRAEKSKTRRHLLEFWMVEPEMAWVTFEENLEIQENMVSYIVERVLKNRRNELEILERPIEPLEKVKPPFPRVTYDEAIEMLKKSGDPELEKIEWGEDFGAPHETYISNKFDKPVFITHFPTKMKAFYMQPDPNRPEVVLAADLLAPEGYGEIIGGSERIYDYDLLKQRIQEWGLPEEDYQWYLDLRKYGTVPHSGFGLGLERTVAWIAKLPHIRETIPFPRMLHRMVP
ncbi:asparagine--tRNA ligase [bacterium 3DAC]|nr:asparagine--tRNA ligase [Dictyoglomota bacterium]UZN23455.1 asparagine--tRNA ligase [bacterium 3DAC]